MRYQDDLEEKYGMIREKADGGVKLAVSSVIEEPET